MRSKSSILYDRPAFLRILVQGLSPILQFAAIKSSTAGYLLQPSNCMFWELLWDQGYFQLLDQDYNGYLDRRIESGYLHKTLTRKNL
jgi:hypothetical protein